MWPTAARPSAAGCRCRCRHAAGNNPPAPDHPGRWGSSPESPATSLHRAGPSPCWPAAPDRNTDNAGTRPALPAGRRTAETAGSAAARRGRAGRRPGTPPPSWSARCPAAPAWPAAPRPAWRPRCAGSPSARHGQLPVGLRFPGPPLPRASRPGAVRPAWSVRSPPTTPDGPPGREPARPAAPKSAARRVGSPAPSSGAGWCCVP